jgi:hypothetical protein
MNHNDTLQNFKREIRLFDKVISRLNELYESQDISGRSINYENKLEGGH